MKMTGWAAVMGAMLLAGACQSTKPAMISETGMGSIAWAEMSGLTQDEIRRRLGLGETGETAADTARLDDGVVVTTTEIRRLVRTPCGAPGSGESGRASLSHPAVTLAFRDGRMSGFEGTRPDIPLKATCTISRDPTLGDALSDGQTAGFMVAGLVALPVLLPLKAWDSADQSARTAAFAELRLGEAPPGGFAAWAEKHRNAAKVAANLDGRTEIKILSSHSGRRFFRYAFVADGKVVELKGSPPGVCVMQADRSMMCDLPDTLR